MAFKKQPACSQRTLIYKVRFSPHVKEVIEEKLKWMREFPDDAEMTISELIRLAVWEYCKNPGDPRKP